MHVLQSILWTAAGIALGLALSLVTMQRLRASKRLRTGAAFVAVLLSSFAFHNPRDIGALEESEDETRRKKDNQSGDPPEPEVDASV
jgi:hypothetical protein